MIIKLSRTSAKSSAPTSLRYDVMQKQAAKMQLKVEKIALWFAG